jgi:hypothetical protein
VLGSMPDDIEKGGKKEQNAYTSIDAKTLQRYWCLKSFFTTYIPTAECMKPPTNDLLIGKCSFLTSKLRHQILAETIKSYGKHSQVCTSK